MAADPKKTKDEKKATDEKAPGANGESSQKKKKLFLIVGLAVALVIISVGGTLFALKMLSPSAETSEEEAEEVKVLAPAIYQAMSPNFTINFNVKGRQRYLQAELTLMYRDPSLDPLLKLHMPAIRNGLVMLFSGKNFDELQTVEGKEILRAEALTIIQNLLIKEQKTLAATKKAGDEDKDKDTEKEPEYPNVEQVLFTNFVMQ